jgi:ElaB/YqjD/DUF883 family membrane-anchored ribosome-binding protein
VSLADRSFAELRQRVPPEAKRLEQAGEAMVKRAGKTLAKSGRNIRQRLNSAEVALERASTAVQHAADGVTKTAEDLTNSPRARILVAAVVGAAAGRAAVEVVHWWQDEPSVRQKEPKDRRGGVMHRAVELIRRFVTNVGSSMVPAPDRESAGKDTQRREAHKNAGPRKNGALARQREPRSQVNRTTGRAYP